MKAYIGFGLLVCIAAAMFVGCSVSNEQAKIISKQAGLYSAVTWVALDNPPVEVKENIISILSVISDKSANISTNQSYTDALYPKIVEIMKNSSCPAQYKPLTMVGAATILGGIDMLFVSYPQWKDNQTLALNIVNSFCDGVTTGLTMKSTDPIMKSALKTSNLRMQAMKSK